jgi:hypothetical protein
MTMPAKTKTGLILAILAAALLLPGLLAAQALFTFSVNDLEAYDRSANWIYDADGPTYVTHDGNWFTYSPVPDYLFHYYGEEFIHQGTPTTLTCVAENITLADTPGQLGISFSQFNLVAFKRINTVDPLAPWDAYGQAGDERVYANSSGYITYNGIPVLKIINSTFVITTPYPNQAQVQALSPLLANWTGDIGNGAPQTGYGFGEVDLLESDPAWASLFAASDYKVQINMVGITSWVSPQAGYFDFQMEFLPAAIPQETGNVYLDMAVFPQTVEFPELAADLDIIAGIPAGQNNDMQHIWLDEIGVAPGGALPDGLDLTAGKYWELGTTLASFQLNIRFTLDAAGFGKAPADWRVLYRADEWHPWTPWIDYTLLDPATIRANNVSQIGQFTVAMPDEENVPVVMSSFTATLTADNLAVLNWTTASETGLIGFRVLQSNYPSLAGAACLTPIAIPAHNSSDGAAYSFVANEFDYPGTYYFWIESMDINGGSDYFGPVSVTLSETQVPPLPERSTLGAAYPNPFHQGLRTNIPVEIKAGDSGTLRIYNLAGQLVSSVSLQQGIHNVNWNGLDTNGKTCASGIYFYSLTTSDHQEARKLVIIK